MRIFSTFVIALGLCACSFTAPLSGPQRSEPAASDAEVAARNAGQDESSGEVADADSDCVRSCRLRADNEYNLCRAQTPGNESNCALIRDRAYLQCPGECG